MVLGSGPIRIGQGIEFDYSSVRCVKTLKESGYEGFLSLGPHLADFVGFSALENGKSEKKEKLTGEESFTLAHESLVKILGEI